MTSYLQGMGKHKSAQEEPLQEVNKIISPFELSMAKGPPVGCMFVIW